MVKTELNYNPYLQETIIKFNGQSPRINSLVEKYESGKLQEWIQKIPKIFHDEMNGYGFELIFSGTEADFERIKNAFENEGITEKDVEFFLKNKLEDPITKNNRVEDLLKWLDERRNRRFNFEEFKNNNKEILDAPYSYIVVNGGNVNTVKIAEEEISVDNLENMKEITTNDLRDIPVVMVIESNNLEKSRINIQYVINNDAIDENQVFFYINPILNKSQIERTIIDLGIRKPIIVDGFEDKKIEEYFELYPLTNYLIKILKIFRDNAEEIQKKLDLENQKSKIQNAEIHNKIENLENEISNLKIADDLFVHKDNYNFPTAFETALEILFTQIKEWRNKKIKSNKKDEAEKMAIEYDLELERMINVFCESVIQTTIYTKKKFDKNLNEWYIDANIDIGYKPETKFNSKLSGFKIEKLFDTFLQLKREQYVDVKEGFLDIIKGNSDGKKKEKILETTYLYETWRMKALEVYKPIAEAIIRDQNETLNNYYQEISDEYHKHIEILIEEKMKEKNKEANQLSDDEKLLQIDNDWLAEFKDKLHLIEKG